MNKIICEICGTTYPETAECCPICGCAKDAVKDLLNEDSVMDEELQDSDAQADAFLSDEEESYNIDEESLEVDQDDEEDEEETEDEEDDEDDEPRHNSIVVVLLTILIVGLLAIAGFIFVRYILPNMDKDEPVMTTEAVQTEQTEAVVTTEAVIPCEFIAMNNDEVADLMEEGQQFLLNVIVKPENTTDKIIFVSADESVATVSEDGKVTAVSEGETIIYISCGKYNMECPVVVKFEEETLPPTEAPTIEETEATEEKQEETVPEETNAENPSVDPNVVLKLKKEDIRLGIYYQFTLELDCSLKPDQVQWSSEHSHIATVDENGVVTAVKEGTTAIIAKYGDQQVQCIIRVFKP